MRSCRSSATRIRSTAACMFGSKKGSLNELRRGRRNVSTCSALVKPLRMSSRAMQADPQISFHEISPPFSSSGGAIIHRLRTDHFIRGELPDNKMQRLEASGCELRSTRQRAIFNAKAYMIKAIPVVAIGIVAAITASCANSKLGRRNRAICRRSERLRTPIRNLAADSQLTRGMYEASTQTTSVPAGVCPVDHVRRNSSLLWAADGSFSNGRRLVRCPPINL